MTIQKKFFTALLLVLVFALCPQTVRAAGGNLNLKSKYLSKTSVKLSWKKQKKAKKITIRQISGKSYESVAMSTQKGKTVRTLKGTKTSTTIKGLKKGKVYRFRVTSYNKKKKVLAEDDVYVYLGAPITEWGDYNGIDTDFSPDRIEMTFSSWLGYTPSSYEVWRKDLTAGESDFKKIASISAKKLPYFWPDSSVTAHHNYQYKVRAVAKLSGKTYRGPYTDIYEAAAVNHNPLLKVKPVSEYDPSTQKIVYAFTSDADNGPVTLFSPDYLWGLHFETDTVSADSVDDPSMDLPYMDLDLTRISLDGGKTWQSPESHAKLAPGETVQAEFTRREFSGEWMKDLSEAEREKLKAPSVVHPYVLINSSLLYEGLKYTFAAQTGAEYANTYLDGERYH